MTNSASGMRGMCYCSGPGFTNGMGPIPHTPGSPRCQRAASLAPPLSPPQSAMIADELRSMIEMIEKEAARVFGAAFHDGVRTAIYVLENRIKELE